MKQPLHIYLHFPKCRRICPYCSFYVTVSKSFDEADLALLYKRDLELMLSEIDPSNFELKSIFVGGGTPSLMDPAILSDITNFVSKELSISDDFEFSMELNPEDVKLELLNSFKAAGINRFSFGVQSALDEELEFLGRVHRYDDLLRLSEILSSFNSRLSFDLIFGSQDFGLDGFFRLLPLLTRVEHLSCYALTIEKGSRFFKTESQSDEAMDNMASQYLEIEKTLKDIGFDHYEVSNYRRNDPGALHNIGVWNGESYISAGPSACGAIIGQNSSKRFRFVSDWKKWARDPELFIEEFSGHDFFEELLLSGLRTKRGADLKKFPSDYQNLLLELIEKNFPYLKVKDMRLTCDSSKWLLLDKITLDLCYLLEESLEKTKKFDFGSV